MIDKIGRVFPLVQEIRQLRKERKMLFDEAVVLFAEERPVHGSLDDYKDALFKHRVSYREYMYGYEFWRLDEKQREAFISQREMWCIYRKTIHMNVRRHFVNKVLFLKTFNPFVQRGWIWPEEVAYCDFAAFLSSRQCIAKPLQGELGKGIFLVDETHRKDLPGFYHACKENQLLIEERIEVCREIAEFHPQSLNTIRVVTMSGHGKAEVLGALLRMGAKGSFVDNTHSGGLFAAIDVSNGMLLSDGMDLWGNRFERHPDSGKIIKGFQIPHWKECIEVCKNATQVIPETYWAGWDICILPDGRVELIEGNSAPDVDGGLQAPLKKGIKGAIEKYYKDLFDFDPISLISVWSRSYKKWN